MQLNEEELKTDAGEQIHVEKCSCCSKVSNLYYACRLNGNYIYLCEDCHNKRKEHFRERCHICGRKLRKKSIYPLKRGNVVYLLCRDCWALYNGASSP